MGQATVGSVVCVLRWSPLQPDQLTALALSGGQAGLAEQRAAAALAGAGGAAGVASWLGLSSGERRGIVRACRVVPALGVYCVIDDEGLAAGSTDFARRAVGDVVEQFLEGFHRGGAVRVVLDGDPAGELRSVAQVNAWAVGGGAHFADGSSYPGLCGLVRLTALVCRETLFMVDVPPEEDLLEIYDRYSVGGLPPDGRDGLFLGREDRLTGP